MRYESRGMGAENFGSGLFWVLNPADSHGTFHHGGLVQIIFVSKWVMCRFQTLIFQGVFHLEPRKKHSYFPLYWLFNRDPYPCFMKQSPKNAGYHFSSPRNLRKNNGQKGPYVLFQWLIWRPKFNIVDWGRVDHLLDGALCKSTTFFAGRRGGIAGKVFGMLFWKDFKRTRLVSLFFVKYMSSMKSLFFLPKMEGKCLKEDHGFAQRLFF